MIPSNPRRTTPSNSALPVIEGVGEQSGAAVDPNAFQEARTASASRRQVPGEIFQRRALVLRVAVLRESSPSARASAS
jgi:hypothetical protein